MYTTHASCGPPAWAVLLLGSMSGREREATSGSKANAWPAQPRCPWPPKRDHQEQEFWNAARQRFDFMLSLLSSTSPPRKSRTFSSVVRSTYEFCRPHTSVTAMCISSSTAAKSALRVSQSAKGVSNLEVMRMVLEKSCGYPTGTVDHTLYSRCHLK